MSGNSEHLPDAEVIDFDLAKARATLRKLDKAMAQWIGSTVELADLAHEARRDQCWRADEDFTAARAAGAIAPAAGGSGGPYWARAWLGWKFNRAGRTVEMLADYGELRAIISADRTLPPLAEPEGAARKMVQKLLRPKLLGKEQPDDAARDEAIRKAWRIATTRTEGDVRAAVEETLRPVVLKQIEYRPIRRLAEPTPPGEKARLRDEHMQRCAHEFRRSGYELIKLGDIDRFDDIIRELTEARARWTP